MLSPPHRQTHPERSQMAFAPKRCAPDIFDSLLTRTAAADPGVEHAGSWHYWLHGHGTAPGLACNAGCGQRSNSPRTTPHCMPCCAVAPPQAPSPRLAHVPAQGGARAQASEGTLSRRIAAARTAYAACPRRCSQTWARFAAATRAQPQCAGQATHAGACCARIPAGRACAGT